MLSHRAGNTGQSRSYSCRINGRDGRSAVADRRSLGDSGRGGGRRDAQPREEGQWGRSRPWRESPAPTALLPESPQRRQRRLTSRHRDGSRRRHSKPETGSKPVRLSRSRSARRRHSHARRRHRQPSHAPAEVREAAGPGEHEGVRGEEERKLHGHQSRRQEVEHIRELVERLYTKRNPSKLDSIDGLFQKYRGVERKMYLRICEIYGVEPDPSVAEAVQARSPSPPSSRRRSPASHPMPVKPVAKSAVRAAQTQRGWPRPPALRPAEQRRGGGGRARGCGPAPRPPPGAPPSRRAAERRRRVGNTESSTWRSCGVVLHEVKGGGRPERARQRAPIRSKRWIRRASTAATPTVAYATAPA